MPKATSALLRRGVTRSGESVRARDDGDAGREAAAHVEGKPAPAPPYPSVAGGSTKSAVAAQIQLNRFDPSNATWRQADGRRLISVVMKRVDRVLFGPAAGVLFGIGTLALGTIVPEGANSFQVSYEGGSGNDLTLTAL